MNPIPTLLGIQENIFLKGFTTFKIGGPARYFFVAKSKKEIIEMVKVAKKHDLPFFILGGGSNLLFSDRGFDGLIIKIQNSGYKIQGTKIMAEAGILLGQVVRALSEAGLSGLEWAAGIPGTLGGAVRGNAGAFNGSIKDSVEKVEIYDAGRAEVLNFKKEDCHFAYRESIFKKNRNLIILSVKLRLQRDNKERIKEKIQQYISYRQEKHPQEPSAGSFFKNVNLEEIPAGFFRKFPEAKKAIKENRLPTAYLIAQCNLIGKKLGEAMISRKHPNFIINLKNAKAEDILKLAHFVKKTVKKKFGLTIEEEVDILFFH